MTEWKTQKGMYGVAIDKKSQHKVINGQLIDLCSEATGMLPGTIKEGDVLYMKEQYVICYKEKDEYKAITMDNADSFYENGEPIYCVYLNDFMCNGKSPDDGYMPEVRNASPYFILACYMPGFLSRYKVKIVDITRNRHEIGCDNDMLLSVIVELNEKRENVNNSMISIPDKYRAAVLDITKACKRLAYIAERSKTKLETKDVVFVLKEDASCDFLTSPWYFKYDPVSVKTMFIATFMPTTGSSPNLYIFEVTKLIEKEKSEETNMLQLNRHSICGVECKLIREM